MTYVLNARVLAGAFVVAALVAGIVAWTQAGAQAPAPAGQSAFGLTTPPQATAAAYIKFDGVDGEAQDRDHQNWSNLLSFEQAIDVPVREGRALGEIVVTKEVDRSTPQLAEAVISGRGFPAVTFELAKSFPGTGQVVYLRYELTNARVTSYNTSGETGEVPVETLSLNFDEVKVIYTETDSRGAKKGNVEYTWKIEEGES